VLRRAFPEHRFDERVDAIRRIDFSRYTRVCVTGATSSLRISGSTRASTPA
jgi:hypothetical protein